MQKRKIDISSFFQYNLTMEKYFVAKNGQLTNIYLKQSYDENNNFYTATAMSMQNEGMGYITYKFIPKERLAWLNKIETYEDFQHQGVATALLSFFEHEARSKRYFRIEGKYYPTNNFAKAFYQKMGYHIEQDGYEQFVDKYLGQEDNIPLVFVQATPSENLPFEKTPEK